MKTRYGWRVRGWSLAPQGDTNMRHEVVLARPQTFLEMLKGGWLTGEAYRDAVEAKRRFQKRGDAGLRQFLRRITKKAP